jgi:hypothetical protein
MVGRGAEMARLEAAWEAARSGERRLVLVGGEPGIGKSRLTSDFARRVHRGGGLVLFGRCDEGMGVPYQPVVEALGRYLKDAPVPALGHLGGELVRLVPEVAERVPGLPLPLRSDPETERYRLFEATAGWLAAMAEQAPVMFALDDMHWATKPTLLLLSHLVRSEERLPLLLVATYRDNAPDMSADLADAVATLFRHPASSGSASPVLTTTGWRRSWRPEPATVSTTRAGRWPGSSTTRRRGTRSSSGRCSATSPRKEPWSTKAAGGWRASP